MSTRYTVRNSSLFDCRAYNIPAMRAHLGGMIVNPRSRRFQKNLPAQLTFNTAQGITPRAVAEELAKILDGRSPLIDTI